MWRTLCRSLYSWFGHILLHINNFTDTERCLLDNVTVPSLIKGYTDQSSIDGELTLYKCSFQGNYNQLRLIVDTFWTIESPELPFTRIDEGTIRNYHVTTNPDCITDSKTLCCQFTTELQINVSTFLDGANVSCWADIRNSSHNYNPQHVLYSSAKLG